MKPPGLSLKLALCLLAGLAAPLFGQAEDDLASSVEAFRQKVAAKQTAQPQAQNLAQLSMQLKALQGMISREEYEAAGEAVARLEQYAAMLELGDEWTQFSEALGKSLKQRDEQALGKWRGEVDKLVTDTKKACQEAKDSAELDPLLVRCAALQMRRERGANILTQQTRRKLEGVAAALSNWTNYLDFRDAGNVKRANEVLRNLTNNDSQYPVLTASQINKSFLTDTSSAPNARTAFAQVFAGLKTPEDLPGAIERLQNIAALPDNMELNMLRNEQKRLDNLLQAWEAVKRGDDAAASKILERMQQGGGMEEAQAYYDSLKSQILGRVIQNKAPAWTKLTLNPGEEPAAFFGRVLDELNAKGDYPTMIEVMKYADQINRPPGNGGYTKDRMVLDQFLAGQRFENVGDVQAAVTNYRLVVGSPMSKYIPTGRAEESLKKLYEKNPEAFKNNDSALTEEIRALRQQVMMLLQRSYSAQPGTYPPGFVPPNVVPPGR